MQIKRMLTLFNKEDKSIAKEIDLSLTCLDLDKLKNIFKPNPHDQLMYLVYTIGQAEAKELKKYVNENFDFEKYIYQLDCFTI
jgi:hypothetical protein